jgi:hypothetical protein
MPNYDVASEEGRRRVQQLAYAVGVVAIVRHAVGTEASLAEAAWYRTRERVAMQGNGARDIWNAYFARGYADALQRWS